MSVFPLKPSHAPVKAYFAALAQFQLHGHITEGNTRSAFADLLKPCARAYGWHLVEEYQFKGTAKQSLRADGALVDDLTLVHGLWEAKDSADDLHKEIKRKVAAGYPLTNILFQSPPTPSSTRAAASPSTPPSPPPRPSSNSSPSSSSTARSTKSTGKTR